MIPSTSAGSVSVIVIGARADPRETDGPLFVTVTVQPSGPPAVADAVSAVLVMTRSALARTTAVSSSVLFPGVRSSVVALTDAELGISTPCTTVDATAARTVRVQLDPEGSGSAGVVRAHENPPPTGAPQVHPAPDAPRTVTPAGGTAVSVTTTPIAGSGPLLVTVTV